MPTCSSWPSAGSRPHWHQARTPPLLQAGEEFVKEHPGLGLEHANSYIQGLSTTPFPDPYSGAYKWLQAVEAQVGRWVHLPGEGGARAAPGAPARGGAAVERELAGP